MVFTIATNGWQHKAQLTTDSFPELRHRQGLPSGPLQPSNRKDRPLILVVVHRDCWRKALKYPLCDCPTLFLPGWMDFFGWTRLVAVLGETGLRKSESLGLKWTAIDPARRKLTVEESQSGRPRYIPLSEFAIHWLGRLVRVIGEPHIFVRLSTGRRWRDPRGPLKKGCEEAGLAWVKGFHDLHHFRATQWLKSGVDIHTVQELLGHANISTTMRYGAGFTVSPIFLGLGSAAFNYLLFKSRYVPRALAAFGVFSSLLAVTCALMTIVFPDFATIAGAGLIPLLTYEIALGLWLLLKGASIQTSSAHAA